MKLSKKAIGFVIGIATIALVGLSVLQIKNLRLSLKTNEQIFTQKLDLASGLINKKFSDKESYLKILDDAAKRVKITGALNDSESDQFLTQVIDDIFENCGLDIDYEYAIYTHAKREGRFQFVMGDQGSSLDFELTDCDNPQERGHAWANLTCSPKHGEDESYHLGIFFPKKRCLRICPI